MVWKSLAFICCTFACLRAHAQPEPTLSAFPSGSFQFQGGWSCEGAFRSGKPHKSTYVGAAGVGGKWLVLSEQDSVPATGYVATYLIGYDSQAKQLVEFDANNFGAATYSSDKGWQNGTLVMTSPVSNQPKVPYAANRFVYTIGAENSFTVDWQVSKTAQLEWVTSDHLVCKRQPKS